MPHPTRSISSRRKAKNTGSADLIVFSAIYTEKTVHHFEAALEIASSFDWHEPFWIHHRLAWLFSNEGRFDDAHAYIERAKSHTVDSAYGLGHAMGLQAWVWYRQDRLEEARTEALGAADVYGRLGAAEDAEDCRTLHRVIQMELDTAVASGQPDSNCEQLPMVLFPACINSPLEPNGGVDSYVEFLEFVLPKVVGASSLHPHSPCVL